MTVTEAYLARLKERAYALREQVLHSGPHQHEPDRGDAEHRLDPRGTGQDPGYDPHRDPHSPQYHDPDHNPDYNPDCQPHPHGPDYEL